MRNGEIAEAFEELGSLYELDGAVVYRVQAYRNAAKAIREAGVSVAELTRQGRVTELAGVGKTIEEKIEALLETGSIPSADKLKKKIPSGLIAVTRIPGLGPKRARLLYEQIGVESLDDLRAAAEQGRLKDVPGFGAKAEENVLAALAGGADGSPQPRLLLSKALAVGEELVASLRDHPSALRVELAGSARRRADAVKDLDIVVATSDPAALVEHFASLNAVDVVGSSGEAGARAVTHSGLPVDLRIVPEEAFGNLLQHFTGSGRHNEALRTAAVRRGLHVSEYGIADDETGDSIACATEEEVYERLGMQWIPPELRENRGELEAAREKRLPELIELADIRGDLHMHSTLSDGHASVEEMAQTALERGYEYVAITDHSATHGFGNDVQPDELRRQVEHIRGPRDRRHHRARRHRDQRAPRRLARLRGRRAGGARLGDREPAHVVPAGREEADRPHDRGDAPPARGRDRASHRPADRAPRPVRARRGPGDRRRRRDGHLPRDQRQPRSPRPQRRLRARGRRGRRDAGDRLGRALAANAGQHALRRGHRAPGLAHEGAGGQHPALARGCARSCASAARR